MKFMENMIERSILASRWVLVIFYLGLAFGLVLYAITFLRKLYDFAAHLFTVDDVGSILKMLGLIDAALVASLAVMVMISGYENFVSRFDHAGDEISWLGKIDAGSLKVKVASTIVAISSIHLLQVFLNNDNSSERLMWLTIVHLAFVASALLLAYIDKIMSTPQHKRDKSANKLVDGY